MNSAHIIPYGSLSNWWQKRRGRRRLPSFHNEIADKASLLYEKKRRQNPKLSRQRHINWCFTIGRTYYIQCLKWTFFTCRWKVASYAQVMLEKLLKSILAAVMCPAGNLLSGTIRFAADIHSACSHVSRRLLMLFIELRHLALISTSNTSCQKCFWFRNFTPQTTSYRYWRFIWNTASCFMRPSRLRGKWKLPRYLTHPSIGPQMPVNVMQFVLLNVAKVWVVDLGEEMYGKCLARV